MKNDIAIAIGLFASLITIVDAMYSGLPRVWESPTYNYLHALIITFVVAIAVCYAALHKGYVRRGSKSEWITNQFGHQHQQYPAELDNGIFVIALLIWGAPFLVFSSASFGEAIGPVAIGIVSIFVIPFGAMAVMACTMALHRTFNPD